jgi:GNAT superfamily N-acetyltransferase
MYTFQLIPSEKLSTIIPLLCILDPSQKEEVLEDRLQQMSQEGYQCLGAYLDQRLIGVSGLWIYTRYYIGRCIEPDNVVINPDFRDRGIGKLMQNWIENYALEQGCVVSKLNCYLNNSAGQRFWLNQGYQIISFHFQKKLPNIEKDS